MKNDAKLNYSKDNRNFQDTPKELNSSEEHNQELCLVNKGFPHYGNKNNSNADDAWSNYDDDKKNSEQEDYGKSIDSDLDKSQNNSDDDIKNTDKKSFLVDTDLGQMAIEQNPNRNDNDNND